MKTKEEGCKIKKKPTSMSLKGTGNHSINYLPKMEY